MWQTIIMIYNKMTAYLSRELMFKTASTGQGIFIFTTHEMNLFIDPTDE